MADNSLTGSGVQKRRKYSLPLETSKFPFLDTPKLERGNRP
jgi:hypothetical protein